MLVRERKKRRLTQVALAKKLRRPQSFVSNYENGERRIDLVEFMAVARAIGFEPAVFVSELEQIS